ncbi:hypothetical protein [Halopolyspora algeriensis]
MNVEPFLAGETAGALTIATTIESTCVPCPAIPGTPRITEGYEKHHGARPLDQLPAAHPKYLLDGAEPSEDVATLLTSRHRRLVEMHTGHRPMRAQPREPARISLDAVRQ